LLAETAFGVNWLTRWPSALQRSRERLLAETAFGVNWLTRWPSALQRSRERLLAETRLVFDDHAGRLRASTEPRAFARGDPPRLLPRSRRGGERFNGAASVCSRRRHL